MFKLKNFGVSFMFVIFIRPISSKAIPPTSIGKCSTQENTTLLNLPPPCFSEIFCHGKLLHTIQMAKLFADSKTFVDMKLKQSPKETIEKFEKLMLAHNETPSNEKLKDFVNNHFLPPGSEFTDWRPDDWTENPRFLDLIRDPTLKEWGSQLNSLWKVLGRQMIPDVKANPDYYSIIPVDNPVIVPGGRFREFYYWDSFWVIKGLLHSEMFSTAKGMLENFLSIVDRFGFVPNGGRIYYSQRSQPPLLTLMVKAYVDVTGDYKFAVDSVKTLEHEFQFWMNNHTRIVNGHCLAYYGDKSNGPRPESYREDIETADDAETDEEKENRYAELKAAAESGMDFSSRWFINDNGTNEGSLKHLKTRSIIPVELNAMLFGNAKVIASYYALAGNVAKSTEYEEKANDILNAMNNLLWHEDLGTWLDYDVLNNKRREYFVPTNLSPLWMKCYNIADTEKISKKVLQYIKTVEIDKFPGGVPNTFQTTGEQWDFPNVWPPMQHILILGLDGLGTPDAKLLAAKWARRWVQSNFEAYEDSNAMFEKYNAEKFGGHGGGGEYEVQLGFGWSNAIIIDLLTKYGDTLKPASKPESTNKTKDNNNSTNYNNNTGRLKVYGGVLVASIALLASTIGRFIWNKVGPTAIGTFRELNHLLVANFYD